MSKRPLSPAPLPPPKRLHDLSTSQHSPDDLQPRLPFDVLLFDEIILVILSYLSWADLCAVQRTNKNLARLSLDNQLWKSLYIREYGRTRLRGVRGFIGRGDGREVRPLPGRARSEDVKDWKWMFRISSNWRTGRCSVEHFNADGSSGLLSEVTSLDETHLLLAGSVTIAASSRPAPSPFIVISSPAHSPHALPCPSSRSNANGFPQITTLALDQSPPSGHHSRFVSFLSTGEFVLFSLDHQTPSASSRTFTYVPSIRSLRNAPIIQAVYHHPILITLSQTFHLSFYELSDNSVTLIQTLSSFTSYPPSSLVLSMPSPTTYKLVIAYAVPVYPAHWSVGVTELLISRPDAGAERTTTGSSSHMAVASTRTIRALDVPPGWVDAQKMRAVREQWGRKVARIADTQTDGKWVVLAPGQALSADVVGDFHPVPVTVPATGSSLALGAGAGAGPSAPPTRASFASSSMHTAAGLQLYRLHLPNSSASASGSASLGTGAAPKLTFVRTLHGQLGPVSNLALADGRCVSLGVNGSVWVWDLEGGTGAEVSAGVEEAWGDEDEDDVDCEDGDGGDGDGDEDEDEEQRRRVEAWAGVRMRYAHGTRGAVVFDDRRIVSASGCGVQVRRFDV